MRVWMPPRNSRPRMSMSGGIVLWAFFWWILIPAYLFYAVVWLVVFVVVNAALNTALLASAVCVATVSVIATHTRRQPKLPS